MEERKQYGTDYHGKAERRKALRGGGAGHLRRAVAPVAEGGMGVNAGCKAHGETPLCRADARFFARL